MPYQLVKFICKYCGREYKLEKNAEEHEKKCYHNEVNRACVTCGNFQEINTEPVYVGYIYVGYIKVVNVEKRCILDLDETFDDNGCTIKSLNNHCDGWVKIK